MPLEIGGRGHHVKALVTRPERIEARPNLTVEKSDVLDIQALTEQLREADVVLSAFSGHAQQDVRGYYAQGFDSILAATKAAGVERLLVVGGAGSLEVAPGQLLIDTPDFPAEYKASAEGAKAALERLRDQDTQTWALLSPAAEIFPGKRTGTFRLGSDQLLTDADGHSRISVQDYAVAMLDELEEPRHRNQRFCVAY